MKTNRVDTLARLCGWTLGLALVAGEVFVLNAGEIVTGKGGATRLLELSGRLVTPKIESVTRHPMLCAKCKDKYVTRTDWTARGASKPTVLVASHPCGGCGNEWIVSGHGKAKTNLASHTCTGCSAESPACCSGSKDSAAATRGMEKKFEVVPVK